MPQSNRSTPLRSLRLRRSLKNNCRQAFRTLAPTLLALAFASVAHAQGTMDFSGAQTLMGTFKTFAVYAGLSSVSED